jgi:hypothetical protein
VPVLVAAGAEVRVLGGLDWPEHATSPSKAVPARTVAGRRGLRT